MVAGLVRLCVRRGWVVAGWDVEERGWVRRLKGMGVTRDVGLEWKGWVGMYGARVEGD